MRVSIDDIIPQAESAFRYAKDNTARTGYNEFVLPPGCEPATSKITFACEGEARLLMLDPGINYSGTHASFRNFAESGLFRGDSAEAIVAFLQDIKGAYMGEPVSEPPRVIPLANPPQAIWDSSQITVSEHKARKLDERSCLAEYKTRVVGQERELEVLVRRVANHFGKKSPKTPLSILIAGSPGTGKTFTAELLPEFLTKYTDHEWGFLCINANQMKSEHTVNNLLGAPPGFVGYHDEVLFSSIVRNPYSVVLIDEIEKATPALMSVFMSVMSSGKMMANKEIEGSREICFKRCILIFTTNLPLTVSDHEHMSQAEITRSCREQLTRPVDGNPAMLTEVAARFTEILIFQDLDDSSKVDILALTMVRVAEQYELSVKHISTELLQSVVDLLRVENGAREPQSELEALLGTTLSDFSNENGSKDIALGGTIDAVEITAYTTN
jgi:ATP-dependent Clp protease ATP-binding subunit ClpA